MDGDVGRFFVIDAEDGGVFEERSKGAVDLGLAKRACSQ